MDDADHDVVAGLFATHDQAMSVRQDLRRAGLAAGDIEIGTPAPGRYRMETRESEDLGRGVLDGIVIGTVIGAALGVLVITLAVPQTSELGSKGILLGLLMGGFWGSFFGGLGGMVIRATAHDGPSQWCEIPEHSAALLVRANGADHVAAAQTVMRRHGFSSSFQQTPSIVPGSSLSPPGVGAPDGPGLASQDVATSPASGHQAALSVPRGAFLLLILFLIAVSALWANVYLRVVWRA